MVAGVDFGDAGFAATVRDGVARVEQLMDAELRGSDEVMTESLLHLFQAGGKRFRPCSRCCPRKPARTRTTRT